MMPDCYFGMLPDLGGEDRYVIAPSVKSAKSLLMAEWREYDRQFHSDYHGQVKSFNDLAEIYGASVIFMPWGKVTNKCQWEPL